MSYLTVGDGLFRQIVVDDQSVLSVITEIFTHSATGVRGQILQGGGIRSGGRHDDGVVNGAGVGETLQNLGDCGPLLANGDVDAIQLLLFVVSVVETFLVDDGVDGQSSFSA